MLLLGWFIFGVLTIWFTNDIEKAIILNLLATILSTAKANAEEYYTFRYKTADNLKVTARAENRHIAFTKASKLCYSILSKDVYPGEEKGLEYIDICSNPIKE